MSSARNHDEWARANGEIYPSKVAQYGFANWKGWTLNATAKELFLGGISSRFLIPFNSTYAFEMTCLAVNNTTGAAKMVTRNGLIKNVAGTTSLVGTPTNVTVAQDSTMSGVAFAVTADNTNDALVVTVTGLASTDIMYNITLKYTAITN